MTCSHNLTPSRNGRDFFCDICSQEWLMQDTIKGEPEERIELVYCMDCGDGYKSQNIEGHFCRGKPEKQECEHPSMTEEMWKHNQPCHECGERRYEYAPKKTETYSKEQIDERFRRLITVIATSKFSPDFFRCMEEFINDFL